MARPRLPPPSLPPYPPPDCASFCAPDPAGISLQVDSLTDHSCSAESDGEKLPCRAGDPLCESGSECKDKYEDIEEEEEDEDDDEEDIEEDDGGGGERDPPAKPATSSPLAAVEAPLLGHPHADAARSASKAALGGRASPGPPTPASKPKLWSLAEIATSDLKSQNLGQGCPPAALASATPASAPHSAAYSPSSLLGRHIYYTSPFYSNYTNYGNFNALQSQGILRYNSAAVASNEGLSQTVLNASSVHKQSSDSLKTITNQLEQHYRPSSYDSKKGRCLLFTTFLLLPPPPPLPAHCKFPIRCEYFGQNTARGHRCHRQRAEDGQQCNPGIKIACPRRTGTCDVNDNF